MILLTVIPLLLLGSYLQLVIGVFEKDKIAYVYDTNSSVNRSVASQARGVLLTLLSTIKPMLQEYFSIGEFGVLSKEIFKGDKSILFIGLLKNTNGQLAINDHIEKDQEYYNDFIKDLGHLNIILSSLKNEERTVRTPFSNDNILLIESIQNPSDKSLYHFGIIFQSQELTDLFSKNKNSLFLANENGELLFKNSEPNSQKTSFTSLDNAFFQKIKTSKISYGTEETKVQKIPYLTSYNKVGLANLLTISMVNKNSALSAIKILVKKSLLFAGLLLCFALFISIVGSQSITKALTELMQATRRISLGDFTSRVKVKSNDEIGNLANSFNLMSKEVGRLMSETAEKARMESELQTARTVQETLFPPNLQFYENLQIAGHYEPASECGGDWWYYSKTNNKVILCIGDATGHGAPAALITSAARSAASVIETLDLDASKIMHFLNKSIYDVSRGRVMMTFFLGIIDLETSQLTYCNASHEPPFLVSGETGPKPKKKDLVPLVDVNNARLGQAPDTHFDQAQVSLKENDFILFYTDGIADIKNSNGVSLGEREFLKVFLKSLEHKENPELFVQSMNSTLAEYRNQSSLIDDVTFFCIKYGRAS